jgi:hypothetical protein
MTTDAHRFQVGDKVRVVRKDLAVGWTYSMEMALAARSVLTVDGLTIAGANVICYRLSDNGYYPEGALEFADPREETRRMRAELKREWAV